MNELQKKIIGLKHEKRALVLAHYYQPSEIRQVADHVCDSFDMACRARDAEQQLLVICGVRFMAESAKLLSPGKTVLLPSPGAGCPMADMITPGDVLALREQHPDAAVVCYVNSSAQVKAVSDVCCTSSSAVRIVKGLPEKRIIFVPDGNLGAWISSKVPEKDIILFKGRCPVHDRVTEFDILAAKRAHPGAMLLVHPECPAQVLKHADFIGSTAEIIAEALRGANAEYIISTEAEIVNTLQEQAPDKRFHPAKSGFICADMKKTSLADLVYSLETGNYEVPIDANISTAAGKSLERMVM